MGKSRKKKNKEGLNVCKKAHKKIDKKQSTKFWLISKLTLKKKDPLLIHNRNKPNRLWISSLESSRSRLADGCC